MKKLRMFPRGQGPDPVPRTIKWGKYPLRRCLTMHHCKICDHDICLGEMYYDGGYGRRAHQACATKGD